MVYYQSILVLALVPPLWRRHEPARGGAALQALTLAQGLLPKYPGTGAGAAAVARRHELARGGAALQALTLAQGLLPKYTYVGAFDRCCGAPS